MVKEKKLNTYLTVNNQAICPNCWGRQEYGGSFFKRSKAKGIDGNNLVKKKGWIQAYTEKYLTGIVLQEIDSKLKCAACHTVYERTS